jgi:hypothetical protein
MADHIDDELSSTLSTTAPASNPVAKAAAMALAMQSFDGANKKSAGGQGSKAGLRFMDVFNLIGSPFMKHKYLLASVAVVVVAAPLAFSTRSRCHEGARWHVLRGGSIGRRESAYTSEGRHGSGSGWLIGTDDQPEARSDAARHHRSHAPFDRSDAG